ncbi:hypothetical protein V6N13_016759 [Hibiscus sabdariffa]
MRSRFGVQLKERILSSSRKSYIGRPPTWCKDSYKGPQSGNVAVKQGSQNTFVDKESYHLKWIPIVSDRSKIHWPPTWCKDSYKGPQSGNVAVKQGSQNTFVDKGFHKKDIPPTGHQDVCSLSNGVSLHGGKKILSSSRKSYIGRPPTWCKDSYKGPQSGNVAVKQGSQNTFVDKGFHKKDIPPTGRKFLIEIKDLEPYELLEDLKLSYLK